MTEDQDAKDSHSDSGNKSFTNKNKDKKSKTHRPLTKIVVRRLPPTMTEEAFLEQVSPIPEHDHFYFAKPDLSLGNNVYARAYINFLNVEDIYLFRDKFDGYVFVDDKGVEYVGIVEYAPFQRILKKKKKKDPKCGTIESDPVYQEFIENLNKDQETENQPKLEYSYPLNDVNDKKVQSTPLLEYLAARKLDKRGRDERRRRENDKRKMRIERKVKDIKRSSDVSEDDNTTDSYDRHHQHKSKLFWCREERTYQKYSKTKQYKSRNECQHGSCGNSGLDLDTHFPALSLRSHNTFTLTSAKACGSVNSQEYNLNSGGDTRVKEDDFGDSDYKKIKHREWEKDKNGTEERDEVNKSENRDGIVFESKVHKEYRKNITSAMSDKKRKDDDYMEDKKDRRDKIKEVPREQKSKKYSDNRKERLKQIELGKTEKQAAINKMIGSEGKSKLNHDDIKPFTQLPQVKTDDLSKLIEDLDRKSKADDASESKTPNPDVEESCHTSDESNDTKIRRSSLESSEISIKEVSTLKKQKSLDIRSKSTDREDSEEKEKSETADRYAGRRLRNKDRPSLPIYQPGMGKFSKQRLEKEKSVQPSTGKDVDDGEKKDT